jgi:multidrug efflux system membrane fusion protein
MQQLRSSSCKSRRPGLAVLAAVAALALVGCSGSRNAYVPPPPPKVVVALPVQKPVTLYLDLTGNTAPFRTVQLVARVQGYLETIDYKDGTAVTKGTQLFGIERDVYQAQLDLAKAQLAHDQAVVKEAQVDLARYQQLAKTNAIPQQQAQDQQYTVEQDEATVKLDQANVETATINLRSAR